MNSTPLMRSIAIIALLLYTNFTLAVSSKGEVTGFEGKMSDVTVLPESPAELQSTSPNYFDGFSFDNLEPSAFFIKEEVDRYRTTSARQVQELQETMDLGAPFQTERLTEDANKLLFNWEEDQSTVRLGYSASIIEPITVQFEDEPIETVDSSHARSLLSGLEVARADVLADLRVDLFRRRLFSSFNVVLVDQDERWTIKHSHQLFEMLSITASRNSYLRKNKNTLKSSWLLTSEEMPGDIEVVRHPEGSRDVRISHSAFTNASPKVVEIEGRRGNWYSKRLHLALVSFVTDFGHDKYQVSRLLKDRFGVQLDPDFQELTRHTTGESSTSFEAFDSHEFVKVANFLEESALGRKRDPQLKYIVRRVDGSHTHSIRVHQRSCGRTTLS